MASNTKKDWPNAAGFAWGSRGVSMTDENKDRELRTQRRKKGKTEGAGSPEDSVGHKYY